MSENKSSVDVPESNKSEKKEKKQPGFWSRVFSEIGVRIFEPFSYPTFISIFLGVVVIAGGSGVWVPLVFTDLSSLNDSQFKLLLCTSLATYFLAIVATAFADLSLIFIEQLMDLKSDLRTKGKVSTLLSLWSITFLLSIVVVVFGWISLVKKTNENLILGFAISGTAISLLLWWIVNNDNRKLKESSFDAPYNPETAVVDELSGKGVENGTISL
jgi:hypothetical protein